MQRRRRDENSAELPRIAVLAGAGATILNTPALRTAVDGGGPLRPQRLARPVTVYVEQFTAHPLERDAAELYAPADGFVDSEGRYKRRRAAASDIPVYRVELRPEDGLYLLPYVARRRGDQPWEGDCATEVDCRQPFFPDAARLFEEIDRFGLDDDGRNRVLSRRARYAFFRILPSGGYRRGLPADLRTDVGEGDLAPEHLGRDFFPYRPESRRREPVRADLARMTNEVHDILGDPDVVGALWLEGSASVEETAYWLNLLLDTDKPVAATASHRPHFVLGNDGDRNIVDAVDYILSDCFRDRRGRDMIGVVVVEGEWLFAARDVQKADARPGGYVTTGGLGGAIGRVGGTRPPFLGYLPTRLHTYKSTVRLTQLPVRVNGVHASRDGRVRRVRVEVTEHGRLLADAVPEVTIVKNGRYASGTRETDPAGDYADIALKVDENLRVHPLAGFVAEGGAPFGNLNHAMEQALYRATMNGFPVVKVARGNAGGLVPREQPFPVITAGNLTATKARLLLMACLMKFGCLPPVKRPDAPEAHELEAIGAQLARYQQVFDSH